MADQISGPETAASLILCWAGKSTPTGEVAHYAYQTNNFLSVEDMILAFHGKSVPA